MNRRLFYILPLLLVLAAASQAWSDETPSAPAPAGPLLASPRHADAEQPPDTKKEPQNMQYPWDFAPREQVIIGRDTRAFRKQDSLLSKAVGNIPLVDQRELAERLKAMSRGDRFYESLSYSDRPNVVQAPIAVTEVEAEAPQTSVGSKALILIPLLGLVVLFVVIRMGLLDREDDEKKPTRKAPRLKVHLTSR